MKTKNELTSVNKEAEPKDMKIVELTNDDLTQVTGGVGSERPTSFVDETLDWEQLIEG